MENITCKSCHGTVTRVGNYYVCDYCRSKWIIDVGDDIHAVERANAWASLRDGDFERAAEQFESIIVKDGKDHEGHWGRALALNGIVYVNDVYEGKKVPTCNNITESSFLKDKDVQKAIALAPDEIKKSYLAQAEQIEKIRVEWLEMASKEQPYDVFISFKDSDKEHGIERTQDSFDAQEIYTGLQEAGYRVFFSRVSLRGKVSERYEPYIYNAIKTAKVMIVFGEKPEYFSSTWIKNEWSRFRARIEKGEKHKNSLVVVVKNMNPGDLPVALRSRQAMNMDDLTFFETLKKHINRVIEESNKGVHLEKIEIKGGQIAKKAKRLENSVQTREIGSGASAETDITEIQTLSLADTYMKAGQWDDAAKLVEDVLFNNPSSAEALWKQLMIKMRITDDKAMASKIGTLSDSDLRGIDRILNCAKQGVATKILDMFYDCIGSVSDEKYTNILNVILPYQYEHRADKIKKIFTLSIEKSRPKTFALLLTTIDSNKVDEYIQFNLNYARITSVTSEKIDCINRILKVDEGNAEAYKMLLYLQLNGNESSKKVINTLESVLKYSTDGNRELKELLDWIVNHLNSHDDCAFVKQVLRYSPSDISVLKPQLMSLSGTMIRNGFYDDAEYLLKLVLTFEPSNPDVYWNICLIKVRATSDNGIKDSSIPLKSVPEYTKYLTLVDENRRQECIKLVKKQESTQKAKKHAKKVGILTAIGIIIAVALIATFVVFQTVIIPSQRYDEAIALLEEGKYEESYEILDRIGGFKDAREIMNNSIYTRAQEQLNAGNDVEAYKLFRRIPSYMNTSSIISDIKQRAKTQAIAYAENGEYSKAYEILSGVEISEYDFNQLPAYKAMAEGRYGDAVAAGMTDIVIPEGETEIKDYEFSASYINSIVLPESLRTIGKYAFENCVNLTTVVIPEGVTVINQYAFAGCYSLNSITIPSSVKSINKSAFSGCVGLEKIIIPDGVSIIGANAFENCEGLRSVYVPDSVTSMGAYAFGGCYNVETIYCGSSSAPGGWYESWNYCNYNDPQHTVWNCGGDWGTNGDYQWILKSDGGVVIISYNGYSNEIEIPESINGHPVTEIDSGAFYQRGELIRIKLPESLTKIGDRAFYYCNWLENINLPNGITSIGESAFEGCVSLDSIELPESLTVIKKSAFAECDSLTSITFNDNLTTIGDGAFYDCYSLTSISLPDSVTSMGESVFDYCTGLTSVKLSAGINKIPAKAFYHCQELTEVEIPEGVTAIEFGAFSDCYKLVSVKLPEGLTTIGEQAFYECDEITSFTLPESMISIGDSAFNCSKLESINLPDSITTIGISAFWGCQSLTSIALPESLTSIADQTFYYCTALTSVEMSENITSIGSKAFYECSNLTGINLPDSLTSISDYAFYNCYTIRTVSLPEGLETVGDYVFWNCENLTIYCEQESAPSGWSSDWNECFYGGKECKVVWNCSDTGVTENGFIWVAAENGNAEIVGYSGIGGAVEIPSSVNEYPVIKICNNLFKDNTSITEVVIPDSVTEIGQGVFSGCTGLTSIKIPFVGGVKDSGEYEFIGYMFGTSYDSYSKNYVPGSLTTVIITNASTLGNKAFYECSNIKNVELNDEITSIGNSAFSGCESLESVNIPTNVISIGEYAFNNCKKIGNLTLGNSLESVGFGAFANCLGFTVLEIPDSVTSFNWGAISGCRAIETVVIGDGVTSIGNQAFEYNNSLKTVTIGSSVTSIGSYAFNGCSSLTDITLPEGLKTIGSYAFGDCVLLTEIIIPDGVNEISGYAFNKCTGIKTAIIPGSVTSMGSYLFNGCKGPMIFCGAESKPSNWPSNWSNYTSYDRCTVVWNFGGEFGETEDGYFWITTANDGNISIVGYSGSDTELTIPSEIEGKPVTRIVEKLFQNNTAITSVTLPDSITHIGYYAFSGCTALESINMPDDLISIGYYAFSDCKLLQSFILPDGVTDIGEYAFNHCTALTLVYIPDSVTTVGQYAFHYCDNVNIYCGSVSKPNGWHSQWKYSSINTPVWNCTDVGSTAEGFYWVIVNNDHAEIIKYTGSASEVNIPSVINGKPVTKISSNAFKDNTVVTSVTVPTSVTEFGSKVFSGCTNLKHLSIPFVGASKGGASNTHFGYLFGASNNSYNDDYVPTSLKSVAITNTTVIPENSFYQCYGIAKISLPEGLQTIGYSAFESCNNLLSITLPKSLTGIGSNAFLGCRKLVEVYDLSTTLVVNKESNANGYVGYYAYKVHTSASATSCISTTSDGYVFVLKDGKYYLISYLGDDKDLVLPDNYAGRSYEVMDYAFYMRQDITSVTISSGVTAIGAYAFAESDSITRVDMGSSVVTLGERVFSDCDYLADVTLSSSLKTIGNYAFSYCCFTSIIIPESVTTIMPYIFYNCSELTSVQFKDTTTWTAVYNSNYVNISTEYLANVSTAATYLRSNYAKYTWTKS